MHTVYTCILYLYFLIHVVYTMKMQPTQELVVCFLESFVGMMLIAWHVCICTNLSVSLLIHELSNLGVGIYT